MSAVSPRNLVGRQVARLRIDRGWSQEAMAAQCQLAGWDISREKIAKIENGTRGVGDHELFELSKVFKMPVQELFGPEFKRYFKGK